MQQFSQRPDAKIEHRTFAANLNQISWDDLRIFLSCTRLGSFRKTALELKLSSSTVVRRIDRLETALGLRLFDRLPDGVALTAQGENIFESAALWKMRLMTLRASTPQVIRLKGETSPFQSPRGLELIG
jgi:hypothetical protein